MIDANSFLNDLKTKKKSKELTGFISVPDPEFGSEVPEEFKFNIEIRPVDDERLQEISRNSQRRQYNRKTQKHNKEQDKRYFRIQIAKEVITGWDLTIKQLQFYAPNWDLSSYDLTEKVPFNPEIFCQVCENSLGLNLDTTVVTRAFEPFTFNDFTESEVNYIEEGNQTDDENVTTEITEEDTVKN